MSIAGMLKWSLRQERAESSRLAWAFAISLVFHLVVFGGYRLGKEFHWWEQMRWPAWMQSPKMLTELLKKPDPEALRRQQEQRQQQEQQIPLMFVDVNPVKAVTEPPKEAKYYSDKNSRAANPDPKEDSTVPRIDGQQTQVPKTEDVRRTQAFPLQPNPPPEPPEPKVEEVKTEVQTKPPEAEPPKAVEPKPVEPKPVEPKPVEVARNLPKPKPADAPGDLIKAKPAETPGDLAMVRPQPATPPRQETTGEAPRRPRPRTIKEALARQADAGIAGRKMKQDGGVRRHGLESSLDVIATPFGAYDAALVAAVQARWDYLLDRRDFSRDRTGKVILRFRLHPDGAVSEMRILENTVDLSLALLCQSAINDPAPYAPWPSDMRRLIGADYREVTFTFYYN